MEFICLRASSGKTEHDIEGWKDFDRLSGAGRRMQSILSCILFYFGKAGFAGDG